MSPHLGTPTLALIIALGLTGCGEDSSSSEPADSQAKRQTQPVAHREDSRTSEADSPAAVFTSPSSAPGLKGLLIDLRTLDEPPRQDIVPLPKAVRMVKQYIDSGLLAKAEVRTYSTALDEARLITRYGKPNEIGTDAITIKTQRIGPGRLEQFRMLRYGWLRILVSDDGEIQYVKRVRE